MYYDPSYGNYAVSRPWETFSLPQVNREDEYDINTNMPEALKLIEDAVKGETEDRLFYQYLIDTAPSPRDKEIIAGIRDDEMRHYSLFRELYQSLTGNALPNIQSMEFERPASYCAGLYKALFGEQSAVTRYRRILYAMRDRRDINILIGIVTDELRHLGLYNYLYAKNGCSD